MVKIDTFTEEDAKKDYFEFFNAIPGDEIVDMSDASYEDKIRFLQYCMGYKDLINTALLTNIALLVFGTKIDDDSFTDTRIIFSSLEEYVDAKYDLKKEIDEYGKGLILNYLAALKSYSVILPDGKMIIPGSYKAILIAATTKDVSKLMNRYTFDTKELPLVFDADEIVDSFVYTDCRPIRDFVDFIMDGLKNDNIQ